MGYFEVDREGLAQLVRRRHPGFIFAELIANAFDQPGTEHVYVTHEKVPGKPQVRISVRDDDPTGFEDLRDAYTLFRHTAKRKNASVRGRFNLGEKEFISICKEVVISTTVGSVYFDSNGDRRIRRRAKTDRGTNISATVRMTKDDYQKAVDFLDMIIPPPGVLLNINSSTPKERRPIQSFEVTLPTEIEDDAGDLRRTHRKTEVAVYAVQDCRGTPWLFEMGIPICELPEDKWDVNVCQKVPLGRDRDSVTPGYLQKLRVAIVNHCHDVLETEDATASWTQAASEDAALEEEAFKSVFTKRFGEKAILADPSDPESVKRATAAGHTVVYGGAGNKDFWDNVRRYEPAEKTSAVFPTSKAQFRTVLDPRNSCEVKEYTSSMREVCEYTRWLATRLMDVSLDVRVVNSNQSFLACYGSRQLMYNVNRLGHKWFNNWKLHLVKIHELIIHEFAHEYEEDHLSDEYHEACCLLGAKLAQLILDEPNEVRQHTQIAEMIT